jgi:pimeloyl-ACP methyl ester carboxylesterase
MVPSYDGTRLYVEEHGPEDGENVPTVVLAHGWTCSTVFWAPVIRLLSADHRVIAYDQRGHGASDQGAPHAYSPAGLADDLAAVLQATLPEGRKAVLVGHSMGGMTLMAAADHPEVRDRTAAAVLCSTGCRELIPRTVVLPPKVRSRAVRKAFHTMLLHSALPLGPMSPVTKAALKYGVLSPGATPEQVEATARVVLACPTRTRAAWGHVLSGLDLSTQPAKLTAPTAVIVGTGDKLTPPVHAREIADVLPDCTGLTELPGLGHMTPTEAPHAVADQVRELAAAHLPTAPEAAVTDASESA